MEKSQPGSSHSLPAKEEPPRVGEEKPKAPKAAPRVEDGGLDTVAPRAVSEHVAITKPEPAVTAVSLEPDVLSASMFQYVERETESDT